MNLPPGLGASLGQRFQKTVTVPVVSKNQLTPVTAVHDVVNRTGIFNAQLPGHTRTLSLASMDVNKYK